MKKEQNPYFQIGLDVMDQPCLVVGGGREAEDKSGRLLQAGACLTLVSPQLTAQLQEWARTGHLKYFQRVFQPADLEEIFLVANTVRNDAQLTRQVFELAGERGILINSYDQPAFSNFGMAALVHPGHLRLSISTSNASPGLARRLRQDLEKLFDDEFVDYLDHLAQVRALLKEREPDPEKRLVQLRSLVADFCLEGRLHYPENWREQVKALLARNNTE